MSSIKLEPLTADAFAPFGQILPAGEVNQGRLDIMEELQNLRPTAKPRLSLAAAAPKPLPLSVVEMERHVYSSQAFIPYDCESYLVVVAPHDADGGPDTSAIRAFRASGNVGVNYHADTWHHPLTALDRPARFVMLTFIDGTSTDEEFIPLPRPITIAL